MLQQELFEKPWSKRTGYPMADRQPGYKGEKFSRKCFQSSLRESYSVDKVLSLDGAGVKPITFQEAQSFVHKYEWLGTMGTTKFSFGLFCEGTLCGVTCVGLTAGTGALSEPFGEEWKSKGLVLVRGACSESAPKNAGSFLIGKVKKLLKEKGYKFLIAYSDPEAGEIGTLYQATNWKFYGFTSPVKYLVRPDGKRVDPKLIHKYAKKHGITSQEQKKRFMDEGYTFEKGSRKLKYLLPLSNKLPACRVEFYPYLSRQMGMENLYQKWKEQIDFSLDNGSRRHERKPTPHNPVNTGRNTLGDKPENKENTDEPSRTSTIPYGIRGGTK